MKVIAPVATALLAVLVPAALAGSSGTWLDRQFGTGGIARVTFVGNDQPAAVAVQRDGKIVVAGTAFVSTQQWDFAVARLHPNGSLDRSFGTGGTVRVDFGSGRPDHGNAVAVQRDGKIVVAGWTGMQRQVHDSDVALARLTANGALDADFGVDGKVVTDLGGATIIEALTIQPDGKLVVGGSREGRPQAWNFFGARYSRDGSLDTTFGEDGWSVTDLPRPAEYVHALGVQPDGSIVAAGSAAFYIEPGGVSSDFALARYRPDGTLDPRFGVGGHVLVNLGANDAAADLSLLPDGKIVAAGHAGHWLGGRPARFAVLRLTARGALDTTFGRRGVVLTAFSRDPRDRADAVVRRRDGKLIVAGAHRQGRASAPSNLALARYLPNGRLDRSFGRSGLLQTNLGRDEEIVDAVLQPNGKVVALGSQVRGDAWRFVVARYLALRR